MGRSVVLGNGSLTVGLNSRGLVHDFYYPHVGQENLTHARLAHHKIGVWVDSVFSWIEDQSWQITANFEDEALVSNITMHNDSLGISMNFVDCVDHEYNVFIRNITLTNHTDQHKNIRLFMHQIFQISAHGRGDSVYFDPEENYIVDYKGNCTLYIYGEDQDRNPFDQYAVGLYMIDGHKGTYVDAEDGELSGSSIEHGSVDSTIRINGSCGPNESKVVNYWIVAADSRYVAKMVHNKVLSETPQKRIEDTRKYWQEWVGKSKSKREVIPEKYKSLTSKSLMLIKVHMDKHGGIIASTDSSIYNFGRDYYSYVWPRDGALAIWPLIKLGYYDEAKKFFMFCRDVLTPQGYMMHKYQPDRSIGSTWHSMVRNGKKELPIQEDETAIVIFMLGQYSEYSGDKEFVDGVYESLIKPSADFISNFIDEQTGLPHASFDLWEEKFLTSTYTTAVVYEALVMASKIAKERPGCIDDAVKWRSVAEKISNGASVFFNTERNALRKGYLLEHDGSLNFDDTLDVSSLYAGIISKVFNEQSVAGTFNVISGELLDISPSGGVCRYENDGYFRTSQAYKGNPWIITTLWMSLYYTSQNSLADAEKYLDWAQKQALQSGALTEQVNPETGEPTSVLPLVWSHAEFINTALAFANKKVASSDH